MFPQLADPLLRNKFHEKSLNQAVAVAAMCLQDEASVRPLMADIVTTLSFLLAAPDIRQPPPSDSPSSSENDSTSSDGEDSNSTGSGDSCSSQQSSMSSSGGGQRVFSSKCKSRSSSKGNCVASSSGRSSKHSTVYENGSNSPGKNDRDPVDSSKDFKVD